MHDRLAAAALATLLASGCGVVSCEHHAALEPPAASSDPDEERGAWPRALVADLPALTPATEVTLLRHQIVVDNAALVATWPAHALSLARSESVEGAADWPRLHAVLRDPLPQGMRIPDLEPALAMARRAERAATGAGTGAGSFNLRVGGDVPFEQVERVLYTASLAGYSTPRVVLRAGELDRSLEWPRSPSRGGPSREHIEAALRGEADPALPAVRAAPPRFELGAERARLVDRSGEVLWTGDGPLDAAGVTRSLERLADRHQIALAVARDVPFARAAIPLQVLAGVFGEVRVSGVAP